MSLMECYFLNCFDITILYQIWSLSWSLISKGTNKTFIIINTYFSSVQDHNPALDVCKINIGILNIGSWMNSL